MAKTSSEIIAQAHRRIRVLSVDEDPSADQIAYGKTTLDGIIAELSALEGATFTWTVETVPDAAFLSLSGILAADIAPHYNVPGPSRAREMMGLRSYMMPDDRTDRADDDEDGVLSSSELAAADRAAFY